MPGGPLTFPCWEFPQGHNDGLLAREASSPMQGFVEAGCSGSLGNPTLVSQTPIRFPGENPSSSLGAHSAPPPPIGCSWQQHLCLRSFSLLDLCLSRDKSPQTQS